MSPKYRFLDAVIKDRIKAYGPVGLTHLFTGDCRAEAERLAAATGREAFRVLDGRLQALRKAGAIRFDSKTVGWVDAKKAAP